MLFVTTLLLIIELPVPVRYIAHVVLLIVFPAMIGVPAPYIPYVLCRITLS